MIIFLYGSDGYRLKQNTNIVTENYRKKHPDGVFLKFDLSCEDEISKTEDAIKSGSLFNEVRLIVIKNSFSNQAYSDRIGDLIKAQNILKQKDTVLLFVENKDRKELTKNKDFFNLLTEKYNMARDIEYLEGENLIKWIKSEFALRKCSIDKDGLKELITIVGNESWILINEIDKLCNFKTDGVVKKEDVILLNSKKTDLNIFDFVDAIAGKNKSRAYEILFKEIQNGRDPYYLLTMVVYGFRNLLAVKDLSDKRMSLDFIAKKAHLHPFVARKTYNSAVKFTLEELKSTYWHLLDMDTNSKEGTSNIVDSLFLFALR